MTEKDAIRLSRKRYRIAQYERECRIAKEGNREKKAYRIPGTREHGEYRLLCENARHYARKLITD